MGARRQRGRPCVADFLDWLVDDPRPRDRVDARGHQGRTPTGRAAARKLAAAGKPTFAYNMGRSERGREAALSHTGAMLASFELREEIIRSGGIVSLPSLRVLEDALMLSSAYDLPRGKRLAAITFSGGAATIIADEARAARHRAARSAEATHDTRVRHTSRHMPRSGTRWIPAIKWCRTLKDSCRRS